MPLAEKSLLLDGQVVGNRIVVVGERGHVLISEDQGRTWQQQAVPTQVTLTSVSFVDSVNGWAAGHDSVILQTRDGGRHWQKIYADPEDERPILDLWFKDKSHGYAVGAYGLFLETKDSGTTWEPVEFSPASFTAEESPGDPLGATENDWIDYHLNQVAATDTGRVFIPAEAGNLYRSDDSSHSWQILPSPYEGSFYGSLPLDNDRLLLFGLRGHLFYTEDAGENWLQLETGSQATLNDGIRLKDGRIVLAGLAGTLLISNDDGQSFKLHPQPDRAGIAKVIETNDNSLVLIGEQGVKRYPLPTTGGTGQ